MTKLVIVALFCAPGWLLGGRVRHHAPARHPPPTARATATPLPTMTPVPTNTPVPTATAVPTATTVPSNDPVLYLLGLINGERQSHGIAPLTLNAAQSACSFAHSTHMAAAGYISHDQWPSDLCVPWSAAGENVGMAQTGSERNDLLTIHTQMMSEPHDSTTCALTPNHACNILDARFTQLGIGIYYGGGRSWLTEDFISG